MKMHGFTLAAMVACGAWMSKARAEEKTAAPADPFAFADFSWAPGNYAPADSVLKTKYFTPEVRFDGAYHYSFSHPADDTISGSSEAFRSNEFQVTQIGVGGDFNYENVGFRLMTQFGEYSTTTPRNDASPARGQWQLDNAYRYISEAYGTYHINEMNGINVQAGIFMSYIGLWSYYNFDNWTYQPSYVSSNTPWFFDGVRIQLFTSDKLKIEPWIINGWQSYGKFNNQPGLGFQLLWKPTGDWTVVSNNYYGADTAGSGGTGGIAERKRLHTDDSVMMKYYEDQNKTVSKAAWSLTFDYGCENGGGVSCSNQYFVGFMAYNRLWFLKDKFGFTFGGGAINNPGRYLVLMPPINGATAATGSTYFPTSSPPPLGFKAWDTQLTADWMPTRNLTFRAEYNHRQANVPYFSGPGGVTPPGASGGNSGGPGTVVAGWQPDLTKVENRITVAMMVRL